MLFRVRPATSDFGRKGENIMANKKRAIKRSAGEVAFDVVNVIILVMVGLITLYPLWYVFVASISDPTLVSAGKVLFWPQGVNVSAYEKVLGMQNIWTAYGNTIFYSFVGTAVSLILSILGAYPLSKRRLKGRKVFNLIMLFTMWFSAGMMPFYLNMKNLGLENNRWGLIFGFAITAFNVVLLRTYFEGVPDSMEESAKMDGANDLRVLIEIYLPLSVPAIMTIGLYYFVDRWNGYFWAMILLRDPNKVPLQVLLRKIVVQTQMTADQINIDTSAFNEQTIVYSTIMVATIPMLALYPFIQKFFVKGIMVGAIKG